MKQKMKTAYVLYCGDFKGIKLYDTFDEAQQAADVRAKISGRKWEVREVLYEQKENIGKGDTK